MAWGWESLARILQSEFMEDDVAKNIVHFNSNPHDFPAYHRTKRKITFPIEWRRKESSVDWALGICVENLDANLGWDEVEELVSLAVLYAKRNNIQSFINERAIILGLSWEESRWLDAHNSCMVHPGTLVFHKWSPTLGTKIDTEWFKEVWVRMRGLLFHLWSKDMISSIVETCGSLNKIDENTTSLKDLR